MVSMELSIPKHLVDMKLFVCYTMRDGEITPVHLRMIERKLKSKGYVLFIDYLNNDSENKQCRVMQELKNSDKLLLLLSSKVMESEWTSLELAYARLNNIQVVPCRIVNNELVEDKLCIEYL